MKHGMGGPDEDFWKKHDERMNRMGNIHDRMLRVFEWAADNPLQAGAVMLGVAVVGTVTIALVVILAITLISLLV